MLARSAVAIIVFALAAYASITGDVRNAAMQGNLMEAERLLGAFKQANGESPEYLQAYSWLARGALEAKNYDQALKYADTTREKVLAALKGHKLSQDHYLEIALGAAIEVKAQTLAAEGKRQESIAYLRQQIAVYDATPLSNRLHKNLNILTMENRPLPPLDECQWLGPKPPTAASLHGKPILLFFWAHWCGDCRAEIPIIARIKQQFGPKGLVLIGPTQQYGYVAGGEDASPEQEWKYIDQVRHEIYTPLLDVPAPVSAKNFRTFGVSTTPTLVLVNRAGTVVMYHPGSMPYEELAAKVAAVLKGK